MVVYTQGSVYVKKYLRLFGIPKIEKRFQEKHFDYIKFSFPSTILYLEGIMKIFHIKPRKE